VRKINKQTVWKEPKRRGGPTLTVKEVTKRLGYRQIISVIELVNLGPHHGGLPGYVNAGSGWELHSEVKKGKGVFFYEEDIEAWDSANPRVETKKERSQEISYITEYDEQMKNEVLELAEQMKDAKGRVNRRALLKALNEKYGPGRWHRWYYSVMKKILDENGYPPLRPQPETVRHFKDKVG
jgi:hypothetical protein